jgi:hypothetical protein
MEDRRTAAQIVLETTELLEHILANLSFMDLLFAFRVARHWQAVILGSLRLQRKPFMLPMDSDDSSYRSDGMLTDGSTFHPTPVPDEFFGIKVTTVIVNPIFLYATESTLESDLYARALSPHRISVKQRVFDLPTQSPMTKMYLTQPPA